MTTMPVDARARRDTATIELRELTKRFGAAVAVDDLTAKVSAGRVTAFLGPDGAGKTTTLRMLRGLVAPTAASTGGLHRGPKPGHRTELALRTGNGSFVLSGAGLVAANLLTGEVLRQTPNAMPGTAAVPCPALEGSPAA